VKRLFERALDTSKMEAALGGLENVPVKERFEVDVDLSESIHIA
jgi:hypothetical protein